MKRTRNLLLTALSVTALAAAQAPQTGGWRRATDPAPNPPAATPAPPAGSQDPSEPVDRSSDSYGQPAQTMPAQPSPAPTTPGQALARPPASRPAYGLPAQLTLKSGTYVTARINQGLSTDHNHVGDSFSATLMAPVIVDGVVVANRGQIAYGRIGLLEKQKSDKPSRLGLELTGLTLADGTQAPLSSQLVAQQGRTTPAGVQAGTVVGTTAVGAAIGGAAAWGTGAAVGAGAGAAAGLIGVLLTRHHATVLYPETALTFQVTSPVNVSTVNAPQAFRFVGPEDAGRTYTSYSDRPPTLARPAPAPSPYYYSPYYYPYPAYYYPYSYWGPSVWIGRGWGWGGGWGWRGRWR